MFSFLKRRSRALTAFQRRSRFRLHVEDLEGRVLLASPVTPTITWANPAHIVYGTALAATQLTGSGVAETFTHSPPAGTVLNAGNGRTFSVSITPTDTTDYTTTTATTTINVQPSTSLPILTGINFGVK